MLGLPLFFVGGGRSRAEAAPLRILVLKTSGCGCCLGWIDHLEAAGFSVETKDLPSGRLMQEKFAAGLKPGQTSCHTGKINGYVIEGHVPAADIKRLLDERPDAVGLAVPNMPVGSPGMEFGTPEPYDVLLVHRDGTSIAYAKYPDPKS